VREFVTGPGGATLSWASVPEWSLTRV